MKKSMTIIIISILVLSLLFGLELYAINQVTIDTSLESLILSINSFSSQSTIEETDFQTVLTLRNPTFVPVIIPRITYTLEYGETLIADGKSGIVFIMPFSSKQTEFSASIYHISSLKSIINAITGFITNKKQELKLDAEAEIGSLRFHVDVNQKFPDGKS